MNIKRKLKAISFDFDKAHLAYTSKDNPACSLMNDPILLKSLEEGKELTLEQKAVLESIGYDISEVDKSMKESNKSSASRKADNLNINDEEGRDDIMSEQLQKEMVALKTQLAVSEAKNILAPYGFEKSFNTELAKAIATVEGQETILKAFDVLKEQAKVELDAALEKAEKEKVEAVEKAKEGTVNPLQKELEKEAGEGGAAPVGKETREAKISKTLKTEKTAEA